MHLPNLFRRTADPTSATSPVPRKTRSRLWCTTPINKLPATFIRYFAVLLFPSLVTFCIYVTCIRSSYFFPTTFSHFFSNYPSPFFLSSPNPVSSSSPLSLSSWSDTDGVPTPRRRRCLPISSPSNFRSSFCRLS